MTIVVSVLLLAILGILSFAMTKSDSFRVERSISINRPPAEISPLIIDFHHWREWSPWDEKDPNMQRRYSDENSGIGASYAGDGNKQVGKGKMEIIDLREPEQVTVALDFERPFEAHNTAEFLLGEHSGETPVTWIVSGPQPFMAKLMSVFISMDKMVGKDFETGLHRLKSIAER